MFFISSYGFISEIYFRIEQNDLLCCFKLIIDIFNKSVCMKNLILLFIIATVTHCHIYSSPPKVTYGYSGTPLYYSLFLALETGIGPSDYLRINWP
jgi:hypothetical protein